MDPANELKTQWKTPGDILSLLLLIGGDVVQKAIAQLVGIYIQPIKNGPRLYLTPVAFSFGWVGYAFMSLISVIGDKQLMPSDPDFPSIVVNCETAFVRPNRSWVLGRILRDHEAIAEANPNKGVSLRIDIFEMQDDAKAEIDHVWILAWLVIIVQFGISVAPWIKDGDWGIFMITACGTFLALFTGSLRQWTLEKWAGRRLNTPGSARNKSKTVCLTRGNGHLHAMVFVGSGTAWDLETLATASSESLRETPWVLMALAVLWTCLLISVSGLKKNTWFLIGVGGLGMLQNIHAASAPRRGGALNLRLSPYRNRPTIIGHRFEWSDDDENSEEEASDNNEEWLRELPESATLGVRGAIRELEKVIPKAGVALMQVFFPAIIKYEPKLYGNNREKKFWKRAFRRFGDPVPSNRPVH